MLTGKTIYICGSHRYRDPLGTKGVPGAWGRCYGINTRLSYFGTVGSAIWQKDEILPKTFQIKNPSDFIYIMENDNSGMVSNNLQREIYGYDVNLMADGGFKVEKSWYNGTTNQLHFDGHVSEKPWFFFVGVNDSAEGLKYWDLNGSNNIVDR